MEEDMINGHTCHSVEHRAAADSSGSIGDVDLTCFPDEMLQNLTSLKMLEFCRLYKLKEKAILPSMFWHYRKIFSCELFWQTLDVQSIRKMVIWFERKLPEKSFLQINDDEYVHQ
ncbi:hypothetical protein JHK86_052305 [Glycine max]|nr:hypothetical protein JHK86_052305 [Glycine max]